MVSLAGVGGTFMGMASSWLFWILIVFFTVGTVFGSLWLRKRAKFIFPAIILQDIGNHKVNVMFTKVGWFKSKKILGGLFDYSGERRLEAKDGRMVQKGSTSNFHEVNYKAGLILREKADDPKILLAIDHLELDKKSLDILYSIAPAEYRDACSIINADAEKESMSKWETLAQVMVFGFLGIILFICIILVIQYSKGQMAEADKIYQQALQFYEKTSSRLSTVPVSTAP